MQRIALRVRAAEVLEHPPDREQLVDHVVVAALGEPQRGAARRQADLGGHGDVRPYTGGADVVDQAFHETFNVRDPAGADERERSVNIIERVPGPGTGPRRPGVRQRLEPTADVMLIFHARPGAHPELLGRIAFVWADNTAQIFWGRPRAGHKRWIT